ncbi:MAG: ribosome maturation factor RimM [Bacteroidetes bacterium]|nr:ribosome maturation factor RimM [Bacteroidota bacterium]
MDDVVLIGVVKKVRGVKGDLKVLPISDIPGRFSGLDEVLIRQKESAGVYGYKVEKAELVNDYVVMKLKGIDSFDSASPLVGAEVMVHDSQRAVPEPGSYFVDSLIGMSVIDSEGSDIGVVKDVLSNLTQSILLIRSESGSEFQIPFVNAFVKDVNLEAKKIRVELIEGLI